MAQIFKAKTLVSNSGRFAYEVIAPNLVYNTGNQNISGVKNFYSRPTVNGTGVLLSGEAANLPTTIVYTTGNQTISGTKTFIENTVFGDPSQGDFLVISGNTFSIYGSGNFTSGLFVNGNPVLTGVDLSSYATNVNLFTTGSILNNKINSLSGYVNSQDNIFSGQIFNTGSRLDTKINSLSGYLNSQDIIFSGQIALTGSNLYNSIVFLSGLFTGYTGSLDANFASDAQLFTTGSTLDNKINSLSGYVNSQDIIFSGQTFNTGSRLDNKINSLSGYVDSKDIIFSGQIASTGSSLYNSILSLSGLFTGYTGNLDANFASDAQLFATGSTLDNKINSLSGVSVLTFGDQFISGNKTFLNNINVSGSGIFNALDLNNIDILSLSGVDISITNGNVSLTNRPTVNGTGVVLSGELNPIIANTGSILDNKINSLSGYVNSQDIVFSGQTFNTGSRLDNKINALSGYVNSQTTSGQIFNTGSILDSKINSLSGYVNSQDSIFSGQIFNTGSRLDNKINSLSGYINSQDIIFSGQVASTGSILDTKINSLSGLFTTYTGSLDATFATDAQLFTTGSVLNDKINSLSGYVNAQDTVFSGQIASSGSRLDNKINALSGYVSGISAGGLLPNSIVYITGNQTISGNKTFLNNVNISGTGNFNNVKVSSIDKLFLSGIDMVVTGNSSINVYNAIYISGNPVLTGIIPIAQTITDVVYTTGNQLISGTKTFANNLEVQGTGTFNALDLSNISEFNFSGTNINLINGNVNISGGTLYISGNAVLTGVNLNPYATTANLFATGSTLDNKVNSLSGYVNSRDSLFSGQMATTGSILDNKINSLSGSAVLTYGNQNIYGIKYFYSGVVITGDGSTNGGYTLIAKNSQGTNGLQFTPAQEGGAGNLYFNAGTTSRLYNVGDSTLEFYINSNQYRVANSFTIGNGSDVPDHTVSVINRYGYFGIGSGFSNPLERLHVSGGNLRVDGKILLSGNPVLTGVDLSSYATVSNLFETGSRLDNKINNLSGFINDNVVFTTGNQTIYGDKAFRGDQVAFRGDVSLYSGLVFIKSQADNTDVDIELLNRPYGRSFVSIGSNTSKIGPSINQGYREVKIWETGGYIAGPWLYKMARFGPLATILSEDSFSKVGIGTLFPTEKVHISGGNLKVDGEIYFSGNLVLTGVDLTSYATVANLFSTGSNLDNKINSLSGLFTSYTGNLDTNFATDAQLFTTGSTLDNKINSLSGYVNSQDNIFSGQTFNTGSRLDNKINSLSGYINSQDIIFSGQIASTGSNLNDKINSLSGLFVTYTGNLDATFASDAQLFATGSTLDNKINSLSGYTNSQDIIFSGQIFNTGSRLDSKINSLSGYVNAQDIVFSGQIALTGSILDNKINSLSGYVDSKSITLPSTIVYTTGDQLISGNKTFLNNIAVSGTGNFNNVKVSNIDKLFLSGIDIVITGNSSINVYNAIYISGNPVLTGVDLSSYATIANLINTGSILDNKINSLSGWSASATNLANTGSILDNKINSLSGAFTTYTGSLDANFATDAQLFTTGSVLDNKINSLSGYLNSQDIIFSGQTFNTGSRLDNKINSLSGYVNSQNIIFSGQIASTGSSLYNSIISLSGLFTGYTGFLDTMFASDIQLFNTGSVLDNKINSLSGYVNSQDAVFSGQTFNTGSRLDSKINSLSGYVDAKDIIFSGQIASSGSRLDNKINNLSGFINDNVVFTTGNQTVLGQKTFSGTTTVIGHFAATSKSFLIDHPLDNNKKLQYASLEGPEHAVFLRGKTNENIINLPNYWSALVDENTISVNLTPINVYSNIYVVDYNNSRVTTNGNNGNYYFYTVYGERKDIPKLTVEF